MKQLLTKKSVAETLDCSVQTVVRMGLDGRLPKPVYIGTKSFYPATGVYAYIDNLLGKPAGTTQSEVSKECLAA